MKPLWTRNCCLCVFSLFLCTDYSGLHTFMSWSIWLFLCPQSSGQGLKYKHQGEVPVLVALQYGAVENPTILCNSFVICANDVIITQGNEAKTKRMLKISRCRFAAYLQQQPVSGQALQRQRDNVTDQPLCFCGCILCLFTAPSDVF